MQTREIINKGNVQKRTIWVERNELLLGKLESVLSVLKNGKIKHDAGKQGSCFDIAIEKEIKSKNCDVGMINPPYSQSDEDLHELSFVNQMLSCLVEGGDRNSHCSLIRLQ